MKKSIIYIIGCLCLIAGTLTLVSASNGPGYCLIQDKDVWNASEITGAICYSHNLAEGPEIFCNHEECGQCQYTICLAPMYPCSKINPD
jgi:hypothetical protein